MNRDEYYVTLRKAQESNSLSHHGILGQKWGIRRFQNPDGTLTAEGRKRLGYSEIKSVEKAVLNRKKLTDNVYSAVKYGPDARAMEEKAIRETSAYKDAMKSLKAAQINSQEVHDIYKRLNELDSLSDDGDTATAAIYKNLEYSQDKTIGGIAYMAYGHLYEDFDQGYPNTTAMMLARTGKEGEAKKLLSNYSELISERDKAIDDYVENSYADIPAKNLTSTTYIKTAKDYIKDAVKNDALSNSIKDLGEYADNAPYSLMEGTDGKLDNKTYKEARSIHDLIMSKMNADTPNPWWSLYTATVKLGIDSKEVTDISNSEWNKINELIKKDQGY